MIYLYQTFESEEAMNALLEKYEPLIITNIKHKVKSFNYLDLKQECMMLLYETIRKYNLNSDKTFNKLFQLVLDRNIPRLAKKFNEDVFLSKAGFNNEEDISPYDYAIIKEKEANGILLLKDYYAKDEIKKLIVKEIIFGNFSPKEFSLRHDVDIRYVYNQLYILNKRIKKEILK